MGKVSPPEASVYPIADADSLGVEHLAAAVEELAAAGASWIQLRIKTASDRQRFEVLEDCCRRLEDSTACLWIDDRVDLAALLPCAGVHLGQADLPPSAARGVLPEGTWIGHSTHDLEQVYEATTDEAVDVVALGPIFRTRSKAQPDAEVGLETLRQARLRTSKPLVAIGGIDAENLPDVLATGVDAVAVIGALGRDVHQMGTNYRRLREACKEMR